MSDLIDRGIVLDVLDTIESEVADGDGFQYEKWRKYIAEMPAAQPDVPDTNVGDTISRQAAIDEIDEWIKAFLEIVHKESAADARLIQDGIIQLPSAQPQRMRGRWIYGSPVTMKCDQCGYFVADWRAAESNYCPSCGADMRGGEQDG